MRVLGSSVLIFEAIILGLFIPVGYFTGYLASGTIAIWVGVVLIIMSIVATAMLRSPAGIAIGWLVQVGMILSGLLVPIMFGLGLLFAVLWWAAIYYGRRAEHIRAEMVAQRDMNQPGSTGSPTL